MEPEGRYGQQGRRGKGKQPLNGGPDVSVVNGIRAAVPLDMADVTPDQGGLSDPRLAREERRTIMLDNSVERCLEFMRWFRAIDVDR